MGCNCKKNELVASIFQTQDNNDGLAELSQIDQIALAL
jgi:hypothetical protein